VFGSRVPKEIVVLPAAAAALENLLACSLGNSVQLRKAAFSLSSNNEPSSTFDRPDRFSNGLA
jgi:hypothetical protein